MKLTIGGFSHGEKLTGIVDGVPAGLKIDEKIIAQDLLLRRGGKERSVRQTKEFDKFKITGGLFKGKTTGANIAFEIENICGSTFNGKKYEVRAGHADFCGIKKYGITAEEVMESASARLTACTVFTGAIAGEVLDKLGVSVTGYVDSVGGVKAVSFTEEDEALAFQKPLYMPVNSEIALDKIDEARLFGDTLGGTFVIKVKNLKCGFGSYNGERLSSKYAAALFNVPSVKGVEIGDGFSLADKRGSDSVDFFTESGRKTNRAGGIEGGISDGEDIVLRCAVKPVPTCRLNETFDLATKKAGEPSNVRSDVCVVPSAMIVARAEVSIATLSAVTERLGSDRIADLIKRYKKL